MSLHHHVVSITFHCPEYRIHNAPHLMHHNPIVDKSIWSDIVEMKMHWAEIKVDRFRYKSTNKYWKKVKGQRCDYRHEDGTFLSINVSENLFFFFSKWVNATRTTKRFRFWVLFSFVVIHSKKVTSVLICFIRVMVFECHFIAPTQRG